MVSGAAATETTLDSLETWRLPLGEHRLEVTATDTAGNVASAGADFTVTTSSVDLRSLVHRLRDGGEINRTSAVLLTSLLDTVRFMEQAGDHSSVERVLGVFGGIAARPAVVRDAALRELIAGDVTAIAESYR
ncbi:hypothetical protein TL08_10045 [Actinoalloteichus hymeniacidonis]|uniref:Bacterial Ig-like domain-containing protein n=1 Tax=Actinoalloteichus hymeniacidonis TaxID=340345 RepID=A0AAC9HNX6_9PSEU|nr:hypothetical protein TL08_10045 [Actinoalloteichus hymeniacidonis]